ncbi:MAG: hypothetical protein EBU90_25095, partial [Proteobacteria bacterium]|nr:hypothetical protein [Pseudomonadota bacterium]
IFIVVVELAAPLVPILIDFVTPLAFTPKNTPLVNSINIFLKMNADELKYNKDITLAVSELLLK